MFTDEQLRQIVEHLRTNNFHAPMNGDDLLQVESHLRTNNFRTPVNGDDLLQVESHLRTNNFHTPVNSDDLLQVENHLRRNFCLVSTQTMWVAGVVLAALGLGLGTGFYFAALKSAKLEAVEIAKETVADSPAKIATAEIAKLKSEAVEWANDIRTKRNESIQIVSNIATDTARNNEEIAKAKKNMLVTGVIDVAFNPAVVNALDGPSKTATISYPNTFQFDDAPDVVVVVRALRSNLPGNANGGVFHTYAFAKNITRTGFDIELANLGTTKLSGFAFAWIAMPKRPN